jgi:hypothetical protein
MIINYNVFLLIIHRIFVQVPFISIIISHTYLQIQEVYDEAGVLGFWKGVLPTLVMVRW